MELASSDKYLKKMGVGGPYSNWFGIFLSVVSLSCFCQMLKKLHKACVKYPSWKQQHDMSMKPWLYPEQNKLPTMAVADLALQRAASLENIDESSLLEVKDETGDHSSSEN